MVGKNGGVLTMCVVSSHYGEEGKDSTSKTWHVWIVPNTSRIGVIYSKRCREGKVESNQGSNYATLSSGR